MRKSTRLLALLLCVVMMATLLPTFALAEGPTVVDNTGVGQKILKMSKDRYTIMTGDYTNNTDTGYGYETTYLFPKDNGTVTFKISRTAKDYNRWWRWAADNTVYNQRKTNDELGYKPAEHDTHTSTTADPTKPTVNIDDWKANVTTGFNESVPRDNDRSGHKYILSKPLLSPRPCCFKWKGGNTDRAKTVQVSINTNKPLGTHSILWSANGTSSDQWAAYIKGLDKPTGGNGLEGDRYVYYGDLGQNFMYIVEQRTVTYQLAGGEMPNGDTNDQQYIVWTTGTASTSQKHKVITTVPDRPGYIFNGWKCGDKMVTAGADLNNGITQNMTIVAQWIPNVDDPDYMVHFNGNGATSGSMKDQGFKIDIPQNLSANQFVQQYTVTYNANGGISPETSANANSHMDGWSTAEGKQPVAYEDGQEVLNLAPARTDPITVVDLYAQWTPDTVTLPKPEREVTDDEYKDDINGWLFMGWYNGDTYVGMAGQPYTVTGDVTLTAKWDDIKGSKFYVYHSATGKTESFDMEDYATVETYKIDVTDQDGETHESKQTYITGYNKSLNLTSSDVVTDGYLYGGTFANEAGATQKNGATPDVANFNGTKWKVTTKKVGWPIPIDTGKVDTAEPTTVAGSATALYPEIGETYYIHEVREEHLQPSVLSTYSYNNGTYNVEQVFLASAVDRVHYKEAGFYIVEKDSFVQSTDNKLYETIGVKSTKDSVKTREMNYTQLNPKYKNACAGASISCTEIIGFAAQDSIHVVPYWKTLDDQTVFGIMQCKITHRGSGTGTDKMMLGIEYSDYPAASNVANAPKRTSAAPLMLMSTYTMGQETNPASIEKPGYVNVVDGNNSYTVEISGDSIDIQPAGQKGKLFVGWYVDEPCTMPAILDKVEDGDTVYAKYISDSYLQAKYSFSLLSKKLSLTSAVDRKDYAETGYVISTKNGEKSVVVTDYASKFALQNANQLFGVEKNAPLMNVDYKLSGLSKNDTVTVTPYLVTADGTTVYGTARTLTYTGLTMKG